KVEGDKTVVMEVTNAINALLFSPNLATLTIIDVDLAPGRLSFSQTNYIVGEGEGSLPVTVIRTNGQSGTVSVNYMTVPGTALPGLKYTTTTGALTFANGETTKTFNVPILEENQVEGNQTFSLLLSNATGGATIAYPSNVLATIVDDDLG